MSVSSSSSLLLLILVAVFSTTSILGFSTASRSFISRNNRAIGRSVPPKVVQRFTQENSVPQQLHASQNSNQDDPLTDRRKLWARVGVRVAQASIISTLVAVWSRPVWAMKRSRTDGYAVQKSTTEWKQQLSPLQFEILRDGGTEDPYFSILEEEERAGSYACAACDTPLFESSQKFHSGTGWPSFADGLQGVEVEAVDPFTANLSGSELRCKTCGGHLGDIFRDGWIFQGTPAAATGRRYCIDGAALVFRPEAAGEDAVRGDLPAKKSKA
jgi:peptide-methionine (R)-S-oxide reductase